MILSYSHFILLIDIIEIILFYFDLKDMLAMNIKVNANILVINTTNSSLFEILLIQI